MAIYHLSGSVISRSQGRSAVACSAYRSATELFDARYAKSHDYSRKQDVEHAEILLPEGAPEWMKHREQLWNAVEACEKRKDAQLAREIQFSLPRELTKEQNIELARDYIQKEFVDQGMVADWALHMDKTREGEAQPHIHVMLTMREVQEDSFGKKVRAWNAKENLLLWREAWAEAANRHLAMNGHDIQIDHRSNAERGIDLEPQHKIGASVARDHMARLEDHVRIARENGEKIFANPDIALDALTRQQSTFTHHDLAKFVHRHTVDAEQFAQVFEKVKSSEHIVALGFDEQGRERFTTQDMLTLEKQMLLYSERMKESTTHEVSEVYAQQATATRALSEEQKDGYEHLLASGDITCLVGYAGTGKSYLLGAAREAWEKSGYRVTGATLSGIAAENLEASSGIESRTLASRMYYWDKGEELLTSKDVLVVDEAGLIGSRQMERLLREVQQHQAKVVLIGDPQQLQAIEAGAAFRAISEQVGYVELTDVRRQREGWQREATQELARHQTAQAMGRYQTHDHVHAFETQAMAKKALVELWNDVRINHPDQTQLILAHTRKDVRELNEMAREERQALGELGEDHAIQTSRGERQFAVQDRVYFLQNDRTLGVKNGSLGTIEKIQGQQMMVRLDKLDKDTQTPGVSIDVNTYNHLDHGYAATIHKAQGVTVDRSYVLASKGMDSHLCYVGMSRHRESADLFWSKELFKNEQTLIATLGRDRQKDVTLDYGKLYERFGNLRGIEVTETIAKALERQAYMHSAKDWMASISIDPANRENDRFARFKAQASQRKFDEIMQFKNKFEKAHPERAKEIQKALRLPHERRGADFYQAFKALEAKREKAFFKQEVDRELAKLASTAVKDKDAMGYLKEKAPNVRQKLEGLAKAHQKSLDQGLSLG